MPKLKNLTAEDFAKLIADADELTLRMWEAADMLEKGYVDRLDNALAHAKDASAVAMAASTLTSRLLFKDQFQKRDDDIERLRAAKGQ